MRACFMVPGEPVGKGRPKVTRSGHAYTPEKTVVYENLVKLEYQRQCPGMHFGDRPVRMKIVLYYGVAKSDSKKKRAAKLEGVIRPTKKPDIDNVFKCFGDALNNLAYKDDTQIIEAELEKWYSEVPRVEVAIEDLSE